MGTFMNILGWFLVGGGAFAVFLSFGGASHTPTNAEDLISSVQTSMAFSGGISAIFSGMIFLGLATIIEKLNRLLPKEEKEPKPEYEAKIGYHYDD